MSLSINGSNTAQAVQIQKRSTDLAQSLAKLASGSKLNSAANGPASLMISQQLLAQLRGMQQSTDDLEQSVNMLQTADGGLSGVQELLQQQRNLALQASSTATTDPAQLAALDAQFQNLGMAINQIAGNTQYAGAKLLDGSFQNKSVQTGPESGQAVNLSIASQATGSPAGFDQNGLGTNGLSLLAPGGASAALASIDNALKDVGQQRGTLGSLEANTIGSALGSLKEGMINLASAQSTIADTDMAQESANRVRDQILIQSSLAASAQQNQRSSLVLKLLGG